MAVSNKVLSDASAMLFVQDVINEGDLLAVYEVTCLKSPEYQYWLYENVENQQRTMTKDESRADFQVYLADIPALAEA